MSEIMCKGCGAVLQTTDPQAKGFIQTIDEKRKELYCKRCYRLMHYNEFPKILATNKEYELVIDDLLKKNALVVLVVDLFDFTGSFIPHVLDKLRNKDVILVANKLDLLPRSVNVSKIVEWLEYMANRYFFRVLAIHIVSSSKGYYIDDLLNTISIARQDRDVYFMGCANVGKSSLINALLKRFDNRTTDLIATSPIPGTTLSSIKIPFFDDNKAFIDTPGLINENNALSLLEESSYNLMVPHKEIKPITYQLQKGNTVLLGAIASIALISDSQCSFTTYVSENVTVHRRKDIDTLEFMNKHRGTLLVPPSENDSKELEYVTKEFNVSAKQDVVISGLGFISLNAACKVRVTLLKDLDVFVRNGIFGK
ncbi:MAG: ribosome biogenesis GTPase YqeH [Acholeplasmatales bacterium]|nr:ribosome biogenesis GTPase YqeH [Acholeplasmatales bacterium]